MHKIKTRYFLIAAFAITITVLSLLAYAGNSTPTTTWSDNGNYDVSWYQWSGDKEISVKKSYEITTAEQLAGLAVLCNEGVHFSRHVSSGSAFPIEINIKNDINLSAHKWIPIGNSTNSVSPPNFFAGMFNGHGKKISGLTIDESDMAHVGFFGMTGGSAKLVNIVLDNVYIASRLQVEPDTGGSYTTTGGIVGYGLVGYDSVTATTLDNCIVSGYITGYHAGGIAGRVSNIHHCVNKATVIGQEHAGGIVSEIIDTTVRHCVNMGEVKLSDKTNTNTYAGGITGYYNSSGNAAFFTSCANVVSSDGGALVGSLGNASGFSDNYWLAATATKAIQNGTDETPEMKITSYDVVIDMPAVAVLFEDMPYGYWQDDRSRYEPYYTGGAFTVKPTLYPTGSKFAEKVEISDTWGWITKQVISGDGVPTYVYFNVIPVNGESKMTIKSGVPENPADPLRDGQGLSPWLHPTSVLVQSVTLDKTSLTLELNGSDTVTATLSPSTATSKDITWSADNDKVTLTPKGTNNSQCEITGTAAGTATVTATSANGKTASCTVTVNPAPTPIPSVESVSVTPTKLSLKVDETSDLTATVTPSGANQSVTWTSGNTAVATVSGGTVKAVSAGTAVIKVTSDANSTKFAECTVSVAAAENPKPKPTEPEIKEEVKEKIPDNVDTEKKPESYEDVEKAVEAISSDIAAADLDASEGAVTLKEAKAKDIVQSALGDMKTVVDVQPLPVFSITTSKDIVASTWTVKGSDLLAETFDKIDIRKIISSTQTLQFTYAAMPEEYADGFFTVLDKSGEVATGAVDSTAEYQVMLFIEDNGDYDLNKTTGEVTDPAVIVKTEDKPAPGGSSGGCSAGFAALALLALAPMAVRKRRNK